jgi:pimeloyl-ACP methyl ester carboxylesterase
MTVDSMPTLQGVEHRFVSIGDITIHVADAGPADGPTVMMVHGFPENWWEWHELIGSLVADGYRVLCPDLRGAGWSSAPRDRYLKADMAEDLVTVLDQLDVGKVRLVAHDWGGVVAAILMVRHPDRVAGFFGLNTLGPWGPTGLALVADLWRLWYQIPMLIPVAGPRIIGDPKSRYLQFIGRWIGAGFVPPGLDLYVQRLREPGHAVAGSRWYRTCQTGEMLRWMRGEYAAARVDVPVRFLHGVKDPVVTPGFVEAFAHHASDFDVEMVDDVGHWIVAQRPELVLDRLRIFLRDT